MPRRTPAMPPARAAAVIGLTFIVAAGCVRRPPVATPEPRADRTDPLVEILVQREAGDIVALALEDYVRGTLLAEVPLGSLPPAAARTMAEVQAIIARTYAHHRRGYHRDEGFDVCATTHCQVYRDDRRAPPDLERLVDRAVAATRGLVVVYDTHPIEALYHADCGGATSPAGRVWGGPTAPYLGGVTDRFCLTENRPPWIVSIGDDTLRAALNDDPRTAVGARLDAVTVTRRDPAGRATEITIEGSRRRIARGEVVRAVLARRFGARRVKSTRFEIRQHGNHVTIVGTGHGHGAGLCQVGAMARARAGHSTARILGDYYPGTTLAPLSPPATPAARKQTRLDRPPHGQGMIGGRSAPRPRG